MSIDMNGFTNYVEEAVDNLELQFRHSNRLPLGLKSDASTLVGAMLIINTTCIQMK
jgi:hypothetical protein